MSDEKPFDFVPKRHRVDGNISSSSSHVHNANFRHEQVVSSGSADACASAQILNALKYAAKRFPTRGNMTSNGAPGMEGCFTWVAKKWFSNVSLTCGVD